MSAASRLLMLGLKSSGKTSFLAALWHLVESGELPVSLTAPHLQPDREYLNHIRESWLSFREVGRTPLRVHEMLSLVLRDAKSGKAIDVSIPDISGEALRLQWVTRRATEQYADRAHAATGVFLFIHPASFARSARIAVREGISSAPDEGGAVRVKTEPNQDATPWSPDVTPTQVQLVELLQFVAHLHAPQAPLRLAVVVSAWDLIRERLSPADWVESRLPLLSQFLISNSESVPYKIFGVSALGGDLEDDLASLQEEAVPSNRIRVVSDDREMHHDLTEPLRFLLNLDSSMAEHDL